MPWKECSVMDENWGTVKSSELSVTADSRMRRRLSALAIYSKFFSFFCRKGIGAWPTTTLA
jgi:hypothetical protein